MSQKTVALGLDAGSSTTKIVGVSAQGEIVFHRLQPTEPRLEGQVAALIAEARNETAGIEHLPLVATGYGRNLVKGAERRVTEITCHARGVYRCLKKSGTLIDIGGQDSKVILLGPDGAVQNFAMNDKCAAGTGRFLEVVATRLGVPLARLGEVTLSAASEVSISSTCVVFAESEIVSLIARGVALEPILRGLHRSLIRRVVALVKSVGGQAPILLSGGVAQNAAVQRILAEELKVEPLLPAHPQLMGAYGAALLALELG